MLSENVLKELDEKLKKAVEHLKTEYSKLQIGRASATLVEHLDVEAYGGRQQMKAVANISIPDAKTIQIQPWDKGLLSAVEKAIQVSGLGLNPMNDGNVVRINLPSLTQERRKELTKIVSKMEEESKITVRNARHDAMEALKKGEKNGDLTEDQLKASEKKAQEKVDHTNKEFETLAKAKAEDIMKI